MKKLLFLTALAAVVLAGCKPELVVSEDGTKDFPYLISTAKQLADLAKEVNNGEDQAYIYYKLTANIDLKNYKSGEGWTPIGKQGKPFKGNFDGGGYIISNLYIKSNESDIGLFGYVESCSIKNMGVKGIVEGSDNVGGIVGYLRDSNLENCYWRGDVTGKSNVGGIAGEVVQRSTVHSCYTTGMVKGIAYCGGVAGIAQFGSIENCAALNSEIKRIDGSSSDFGRVAGFMNERDNFAWKGMKVKGDIVSKSYIDGDDMSKEKLGMARTFDKYFKPPLWKKVNGYLPGFKGKTEKEKMPDYIK